MLGLGNSISHAGSISFAPTDISGLQFWLQNGVGITSSGDPAVIDAWADSSGNGLNATASVGRKPYLVDGGGEWEGDSDADALQLSAAQTINQFHIFFAIAADEHATNNLLANANTDFLRIGQGGSSTQHRIRANGQTVTLNATTAIATDGTRQLLEYEGGDGSSSNVFLRINGTLESTSSLDTDSNPFDYGFVGAVTAEGTSSFDGKIYEVLVYNKALSSAEATDVRNYLNGKLNIY